MPMTVSPEELTVTRNDAAGRYEIHVGDVLGGYTLFEIDPRGRLVFPHTEIDHAYRGWGLSTVLISQAMADVAERGETIVPVCPVVRRYLRHHELPGLKIEWPAPLPGERVG